MLAKEISSNDYPWHEQIPNVQHFITVEGLTHYAKLYLPNIYDRLCYLKSRPNFQERRKIHFHEDDDVIAYMSFLWLSVMEYPPHDDELFRSGWNSQMLATLERCCQGDSAIVEEYFAKAEEWEKEWGFEGCMSPRYIWPKKDEPDEFWKKHESKIRL